MSDRARNVRRGRTPPSHGPAPDVLRDIELLVRSKHSLIHVESTDGERVETLLMHVADHLAYPLFVWTRTRGLSRSDLDGAVYGTEDAGRAFTHVAASGVPALYFFEDLYTRLQSGELLIAQIKDAAQRVAELGGAILFAGTGITVPPELEGLVTTVSLPGPTGDEFRSLIRTIMRDVSLRQRVDIDITEPEMALLVNHLAGLTAMEAEKILTKAIIEDGRLSVEDIDHVIEAKRAVVEREGLLEYYPLEETVAEVADLVTLKSWLRKRKAIISEPEKAREFGLTFPRGVLLLGVPGCGKSLSAKAVAREWHLPLLKLDPSNLYNKFIGESERNFKRAMETAERMSPVVLWIDELEKAFASGGEDGGVSMRILGSFLSWMQERRGDVFVVATANDISRLPPEFLRKGRFDEIFFVDLPDAATRSEIFRIHLANRDQDPATFDLDELAGRTDGFSGAEIEQVVLSSLYTAFSGSGDLTDALLISEVGRTRPLATTMAERVAAMREWAKERAVPAN